MDKDLLNTINETIVESGIDARFVDEDKAVQLVKKIAERHSFDIDRLFIWEKTGGKAYNYQGDAHLWQSTLLKLLDSFETDLFLVISDEHFFPWKVLECQKDELMKLLAEQRYFEYFIFDSSMNQVLFDTHHNQIIMFR